jgi:hypothetical protein
MPRMNTLPFPAKHRAPGDASRRVSWAVSRIPEISRKQNSRRQRRERDQALGERSCTFRENFDFEPREDSRKERSLAAKRQLAQLVILSVAKDLAPTSSGVLWSDARSFASLRTTGVNGRSSRGSRASRGIAWNATGAALEANPRESQIFGKARSAERTS